MSGWEAPKPKSMGKTTGFWRKISGFTPEMCCFRDTRTGCLQTFLFFFFNVALVGF